MKLSRAQYERMWKEASPRSTVLKDCIYAFLIGGAICCVGQLINNFYTYLGMGKTIAGTLTSATLIGLSALLTGIGVYDKMSRVAGAGTLVPITGFANAVVSSALEFKTEGYVMGVGAKMFLIAGPVIVYGTAASVIYGIILYIAGCFA